MVWRKREGTVISVIGAESDYVTPRVSPDGSRIAVTKVDPDSGDYDMWIEEWSPMIFSRFTFQRGLNYYPVWTPDGKSIVYVSNAIGQPTLFLKDVAGSQQPEQLIKPAQGNEYTSDISPDGKSLLFTRSNDIDRSDIWILPLDGRGIPFPYLKTPAGEFHAQFSPGRQGGKWIVYTSDESGIEQIYVRRFTGGAAPDARWQISLNGGSFPRWRGDGSEIIFLAPDGKLMSAPIHFLGNSIEAGTPVPLFDAGLPVTPFLRYPYDVSPDGKKILVLNAPRGRPPGNQALILHWTGILKR